MKDGVCKVTENIVDVVQPVPQGTPQAQSWYLLLPAKTRSKKKFAEDTKFLVIEAANGDIIYRPQGA